MAHLLIARSQLNPDPSLSFKFAILFSAFKSLSSVHDTLTTTNISGIPSFHVCGQADQIVNCQRSEDLAKMFTDPRAIIVHHSGGHCIPPISQIKSQILEFANNLSI
ncbi:serine hydrolase (FSH1) domain-containing protein [Ditylenchus destructor]|nr:serine hydrolase (FSH1) domain-containing protein [Ditylenchus destructor]